MPVRSDDAAAAVRRMRAVEMDRISRLASRSRKSRVTGLRRHAQFGVDAPRRFV